MFKKTLFLSATGLLLIFATGCQKLPLFAQQTESTAEVCSYEVVATYPHDPQAFTQGLVIVGGKLYEGTGQYGQSLVREVDLVTGNVLKLTPLDQRYFGEGITIWEDRLIQLTWRSRQGFVYSLPDLEVVAEFTYPTEGWGLTHNEEHLILSDGTATLYFLDPQTFKTVKSVQVKDGEHPIERLNELEFINGEIYANVWQQDRIVRINPETGQVTGWLDLRGLYPKTNLSPDAVLNGIAYDVETQKLYVTGKLWSALFEVEPKCEES